MMIRVYIRQYEIHNHYIQLIIDLRWHPSGLDSTRFQYPGLHIEHFSEATLALQLHTPSELHSPLSTTPASLQPQATIKISSKKIIFIGVEYS